MATSRLHGYVRGLRRHPELARALLGVFLMSNQGKRIEGAADELVGKVKAGLGGVIGTEQMQAEGRAKELQGVAQQEAAKAAERTKGTVEQVVGTVKTKVGALIGNEQMEVEGKAKELQGDARKKANE